MSYNHVYLILVVEPFEICCNRKRKCICICQILQPIHTYITNDVPLYGKKYGSCLNLVWFSIGVFWSLSRSVVASSCFRDFLTHTLFYEFLLVRGVMSFRFLVRFLPFSVIVLPQDYVDSIDAWSCIMPNPHSWWHDMHTMLVGDNQTCVQCNSIIPCAKSSNEHLLMYHSALSDSKTRELC